MSVKFRTFSNREDEALLAAAQFATEVGHEKLISISHAFHGATHVTVWYWDNDVSE